MEAKCLRKGCLTIEGLTRKRIRISKSGPKPIYICRFHNAEEKRKERKRNPAAAYRAIARYRAKNPERTRIRRLAGKKIPLQPCEVCGNLKAVRHHDDYSKPLEVKFYCHMHHRQFHKVGAY